jgi:hypothetical protein
MVRILLLGLRDRRDRQTRCQDEDRNEKTSFHGKLLLS